MHTLTLAILVGSAAAVSINKPKFSVAGHNAASNNYESILEVSGKKCKRFVEKLTNQGNGAAYLGKMYIGGQKLDVIWDTGSDEEVINSVNAVNLRSSCKNFNGQSKKGIDCYDRDKSKYYKPLASFPEKISYGSGDTYVLPGIDRIAFIQDKCGTKGVKFQELISSDIPQLLSHDIDAVAGVGPMGWKKKQFLVQMGVGVFSFCFKADTSKSGLVIWGDHPAKDNPEGFNFVTMPNRGSDYWAIKVSDFTMAPHEGKGKKLGCVSEDCFAVVDTGTSLITLDENTLKMFETTLNNFEKKSGIKCNDENLHKFPTLKFKLAGKEHEFKPQDYLLYTEKDNVPSFVRSMMHFDHSTFPWLVAMDSSNTGKPKKVQKECVMMFTPPMGKGMAILGMPFFRNYMVTFDRNDRSISTAPHNGECKPHSHPSSLLNNSTRLRQIDASKLRISSAYTRLLGMHKKGINVMDLFRHSW